MKKIITLLAVIGIFSFQSCTTTTDSNYVDNDTIAEAFEIKAKNFYNDPNDSPDEGYFIYGKFNPPIYSSDVVLIYRLSGIIDSNTPIWQLIPRTLFLAQGELDYDFDFSKEDYTIYAGGTYNLALTPQYINNQTFRIVIVPANLVQGVDKNSYPAVMSALNIKENQIQKINF